MMPLRRSGLTMIELVVALTILGLMLAVSGVAFAVASRDEEPSGPEAVIADARNEAISTGRIVSVTLVHEGNRYPATALPDGRVVADPVFGIEATTGRVEQ